MPQRRDSNDGNRKVKSQRRSQKQRRSKSDSHNKTNMRRNVGEILGEAIHALDIEDELAARGALTIMALQ